MEQNISEAKHKWNGWNTAHRMAFLGLNTKLQYSDRRSFEDKSFDDLSPEIKTVVESHYSEQFEVGGEVPLTKSLYKKKIDNLRVLLSMETGAEVKKSIRKKIKGFMVMRDMATDEPVVVEPVKPSTEPLYYHADTVGSVKHPDWKFKVIKLEGYKPDEAGNVQYIYEVENLEGSAGNVGTYFENELEPYIVPIDERPDFIKNIEKQYQEHHSLLKEYVEKGKEYGVSPAHGLNVQYAISSNGKIVGFNELGTYVTTVNYGAGIFWNLPHREIAKVIFK